MCLQFLISFLKTRWFFPSASSTHILELSLDLFGGWKTVKKGYAFHYVVWASFTGSCKMLKLPGFSEPFPWCIAIATLPNKHGRWGQASWGVHQVHLSQMQTSARLAFKSKLQIGYARHFELVSSLNSAVVISVLALYAFSWMAMNKISVPENPLC